MTTTPYHLDDIAAAIARALATARDRPQPAEDASCSPQKYAGYGPKLPRRRLETLAG